MRPHQGQIDSVLHLAARLDMTPEEISPIVRLWPAEVAAILAAGGRSPLLRPDEVCQAIRLCDAGAGTGEVARELGRDEATVLRSFRLASPWTRPTNHPIESVGGVRLLPMSDGDA